MVDKTDQEQRYSSVRSIITVKAKLRFVLFDWGDTLMSEAGPLDIPMADWRKVRVIEGAPEVLSLLSKSYRVGIATNATVSKKPDIACALERVGLNAFIDDVFCFTELGYKKSEPEFWDAVLTRLGAQKNELVMIGDSLEQDVLGPMRIGIRAIWFNWKQGSYSGPLSIRSIQALQELPAVIEEFA
jgi:FMN phosphatase YigB (HAD superfamily)